MNSHVYFATPPIPRSCAYLDSIGKFGFRAWIGLQNKCRAPAEFRLVMLGSGLVRASTWGPFTTLWGNSRKIFEGSYIHLYLLNIAHIKFIRYCFLFNHLYSFKITWISVNLFSFTGLTNGFTYMQRVMLMWNKSRMLVEHMPATRNQRTGWNSWNGHPE